MWTVWLRNSRQILGVMSLTVAMRQLKPHWVCCSKVWCFQVCSGSLNNKTSLNKQPHILVTDHNRNERRAAASVSWGQTPQQQQRTNCYSLPLHDFSSDLMLISKKPESCWLVMAAASCWVSPLELCFPPVATAAAAAAAAAEPGPAGSACCHFSVTHTMLCWRDPRPH